MKFASASPWHVVPSRNRQNPFIFYIKIIHLTTERVSLNNSSISTRGGGIRSIVFWEERWQVCGADLDTGDWQSFVDITASADSRSVPTFSVSNERLAVRYGLQVGEFTARVTQPGIWIVCRYLKVQNGRDEDAIY